MLEANKKDRQNIVTLSYNLRAKMVNVLGLSTDCNDCSRCLHRYGKGMKKKDFINAIKNGAILPICIICYAIKYMLASPNARKAYHYNSEVLKKRLLSDSELKAIAHEIVSALRKNKTHKFRLESFGDLSNEIQTLNYLRLCSFIKKEKRNYRIQIGLWTKNYDILIRAWEKLEKDHQNNCRKILSVILSSVFVEVRINQKIVDRVSNILGTPVKTFTVEIEETEKTNCGAKCCDTCGICYNAFNGIQDIFEVCR